MPLGKYLPNLDILRSMGSIDKMAKVFSDSDIEFIFGFQAL